MLSAILATALATVGVIERIETHHVNMPDPSANPTATAAKSGLWNDPATWSGQIIPHAADRVRIPLGVDVTISGDAAAQAIGVHGTLRVEGGAVEVGTFVVFADGALLSGAPGQPSSGRITFTGGPIDTATDPEQFTQGLVCFGRCALYGDTGSLPFAHLATPAGAGANSLQFLNPPGWRVGDRVWLTDGRVFGTTRQHEFARVAAVDGTRVDLAEPLTFPHSDHVANLTRSFVVNVAPGGRAHTLFTNRANVDLHGVSFVGIGRTSNNELINDTTYDAANEPVTIGTNQRGRYSVHFHHCYGPAPGTRADYQFTVIDCVIENEPWQKWGLTVHGSSDGLLSGNVIIYAGGAGIMCEDRDEIRNVITGNLIGAISGHGGRGKHAKPGGDPARKNTLDARRGGAGIWGGPGNHYIGNVVVDTVKAGVELWGGNDGSRDTILRIAARPGGSLTMGEPGVDWVEQSISAVPWGECRDNYVYGAQSGIEFWYVGYLSYFDANPNSPRGRVENFRARNIQHDAALLWQANNVEFVGFSVDKCGRGLFAPRVRLVDWIDCEFRGTNTGIAPAYTNLDRLDTAPVTFRRCTFEASESCCKVSYRQAQTGAEPAACKLEFDSCRFEGPRQIDMAWNPGTGNDSNPVEVISRNHNGTGANLQVYYAERPLPDGVLAEPREGFAGLVRTLATPAPDPDPDPAPREYLDLTLREIIAILEARATGRCTCKDCKCAQQN